MAGLDLIDRLRAIGDRIGKLKNQVETEEATKNAFVMPFISALGYDVFNPIEVVPEFIADVGIKKGEKVDYCIMKDGKPILIVECKHWKEPLNPHNSQLFRYFHVAAAKFAFLTNGIEYRFYTDLVEPNKMDEKPFLEFSLENITEPLVNELKKFQKDKFDVQEIFLTASDLKYSKEIKEVLVKELNEPSEEFIKHFTSKVYTGRLTAKILEQFSVLVAKSVKTLISEMISERLQTALNREKEDISKLATPAAPAPDAQPQTAADSEEEGEIVTTEEEKEGFLIIRAILRKEVDVKRVFLRDTKSYCGILLDDNNRKPVCRLRFNRNQKYLGLFNANKEEEKVTIETLEDIYKYADRITQTVKSYEKNEG
ncbi:MAG: type I restriction enzyme HsdR N-terminal domain-containing protein [Saprospiraceae bacterium]|nr:type I restriction enzyme HsdR N-terminal domain-containing protein [Saprospiraceae bacterium]NUQ23808.1 type I restriction enzyme HsdR N-terminal domain-containing protein [Saprospiraceae bacterium]